MGSRWDGKWCLFQGSLLGEGAENRVVVGRGSGVKGEDAQEKNKAGEKEPEEGKLLQPEVELEYCLGECKGNGDWCPGGDGSLS